MLKIVTRERPNWKNKSNPVLGLDMSKTTRQVLIAYIIWLQGQLSSAGTSSSCKNLKDHEGHRALKLHEKHNKGSLHISVEESDDEGNKDSDEDYVNM